MTETNEQMERVESITSDAILTVDFRQSFSSLTEDVENTARVCIDLKAIQSGLIKEVGANRFAILLSILSYMDSSGRAFPSQDKIAELTGQGRATVQRNLDALCEAEFKGQRLLFRDVVGTIRKKTIYTLNQAMITNTEDVEEALAKETIQPKAEVIKGMNARDVGMYFLDVFEQSFGFKYNMTFARELSMIKNKLISKYSDDEIKAIINIGVGEYKDRWAKPSYPHPTVSMICGWVGNEAISIYKAQQDEEQQQIQRQVAAVEQDDTDKALDSLFN